MLKADIPVMDRTFQIKKADHPRPVSSRRPFIIPFFLPHIGCTHRCVFCNQTAVTGVRQNVVSPEQFRYLVKRFLAYRGEQRDRVQIAFYGGNFLGQKKNQLTFLLDEASKFVFEGDVDSLRFSTRPDTINDESLDILEDYPVATIEIGVQSMDDDVLTLTKRGHTALDTQKAVHLLKQRKYEIGLQIMVGLPGDDEIRSFSTAEKVAGLFPDFVRIYPTVVLKESLLAKWYLQGRYTPLSLGSTVTLVKKLFLFFARKQIQVIRMGLQASDQLENGRAIMAGPYHPAFGHLVYSEIFMDRVLSHLNHRRSGVDAISIKLHPRNTSHLRGLNNQNIKQLKKTFLLKTVQIISDFKCPTDQLVIDGASIPVP